jgi:signal transduction histidine kinase
LIPGPDGAPVAVAGSLRDLRPERARTEDQRRFATLLNHEFRTPLATIDGAIQRLEATGAEADPRTRERYRKIQTAVDRLVHLLDDFLSPARLEAIGKTRSADRIDPRVLLEEAAEQLRGAGREASLACVRLPSTIRCQPQGLRMVMRLLVDNVLRHAPGAAPVQLTGQDSGNGLELRVRDHGPGLAADELERIFEKHYRGAHAAGEGAGLGLYMVRSVVDVHGGTVQARQAEGGGAEFVVWLPVVPLGKLAA